MPTKLREMQMLTKRAREHGVSIRSRLALYWASMVLAMLAAALLLLSITGVTSRTSRQFGETVALQQQNSAAAIRGQMDTLTARSVALSEQISEELNIFLAERGIAFEALNDDPELIAELETVLLPVLDASLGGSACSGAYLCLDATANTALPEADRSRMGLYLRYSSLRSANPSGNVVLFRGAVGAARSQGVQLHNRWNPELDTSLIPGYRQVMTWSGQRLAEGCLWTERVPLLDTWEDVTLLCVPILDGSGTVRGICGIELSDLFFTLAHDAVSGPYGSFLLVLAPLNGDTLLLDRAMLGSTQGAALRAEGVMTIRHGQRYDTFTCGDETYLGAYQILPGKLADGYPLAAVTMVPEGSYQRYAASVRRSWIIGSLIFLLAMLVVAVTLSHRFAKPIARSLAAIQDPDTAEFPRSGISEIDQLAEYLRSRPAAALSEEALPPGIAALFSSFVERSAALTGTERQLLRYYAGGKTIGEIPELMFISASTVKTHNRNIYSKLGVSSYDGLMAYIEMFRRCDRLDALLGNEST